MSLSLQQYERAFRENAIDVSILPELTDSDLEKIGVLLGHRKKILKAISESILPAANSQSSIGFSPQRFSPPDRMERRHMTIMFCDLVGSTALSVSVDIEDLRDLLAKYHRVVRDEVTRLGGFVARYMGDGVLTYFGYPEANEDDPERCVQAALNIKTRVPSLEIGGSHLSVRIGIATGLVVVGDLLGDGEPQEYGVVGETPNLAARLQTAAKPNGILIADATRRLIGELFELVLRFSHLIQLICLRIAGPAVLSRSKVKRLTDSEH
jgi:class 3 adenylate cyclase